VWLFWPFWWSPELLSSLPTAQDGNTYYRPVQQKFILTNAVALLLLLAFFVHKLRTDRPIGVYADTLLFFFAMYILIDTAEFLAKANSIEHHAVGGVGDNGRDDSDSGAKVKV
jgi:hypothetical protein